VSAEYTLRAHFEHAVTPEQAVRLLPLLQDLLLFEPAPDSDSKLGDRYAWTNALLPPLLERALAAERLADSSIEIICGSFVFLDEIAEEGAGMGHLHFGAQRHAPMRLMLFETLVDNGPYDFGQGAKALLAPPIALQLLYIVLSSRLHAAQ
jgi:hypothetical protein